MPSFDTERLSENLSDSGACLVGGFFVIWTAFAGFCFVFGIAFILAVIGLTIWALMTGQVGNNPWVFFAIAVPTMVAYQWVSWRFFRFGLAVLRANARGGDPFDADGRPKKLYSESD